MPSFFEYDAYTRAREQFSSEFTQYFDSVLSKHEIVSLEPSNTPAGLAYAVMNVAFLGIPAGLYYLQNQHNERVRQHLKESLIDISESPERVQLCAKRECMAALRSQVLRFKDIRYAPVSILNILTLPRIHNYLKLNKELIESRKKTLIDEKYAIESRMRREDAPEDTPANREAVRRLTDQINSLETHMEKIRKEGYQGPTLNNMIDAVYESWSVLDTKFQQQLRVIASQIRKLETLGTEAEPFVLSAKQLKLRLENAHSRYIQSIQSHHSYSEKLALAEQFINEGHQAILEARDILCNSLGYGWQDFLWDILNTLILIATIGISYAVTGRFRLFQTNTADIEMAGNSVTDEAQVAVELYANETEKLGELITIQATSPMSYC